ncbi:uncharacterized protein LOC130767224 isoform X2 [Actinidia eriantha]|uniref:uncharacterized protein LOC130767224 isoform X2 n=1 Tax=Actinidia eriantha TaxID=165200 RepID=UPI00258A93CD|nr:uncharacterized protein LOC130767224 isoform X2 [Actinidia eriantha]
MPPYSLVIGYGKQPSHRKMAPPPPPPPTSPSPTQSPPDSLLVAVSPRPPDAAVPNAQHNRDFTKPVVAFCLATAVETAIRSLQNSALYPVSFHFLCLFIVLAFASIVVSKYIAPKHPNGAPVLENLGVFFGVTAFFVAITMAFPLCLKVISWLIYGLLLAGTGRNCRRIY